MPTKLFAYFDKAIKDGEKDFVLKISKSADGKIHLSVKPQKEANLEIVLAADDKLEATTDTSC